MGIAQRYVLLLPEELAPILFMRTKYTQPTVVASEPCHIF